MAKSIISYSLNNDGKIISNKINGLVNNNCIVYIENGIKTKITVDTIVKLERTCNDYNIELIFENNKITYGKYYLKEYKKNVKIKIDTKNIIIKERFLFIEYNLYMEDINNGLYKFTINY